MIKNNKYILAMDCGTTNIKSLIIDQKGKVIAISKQELTQYYPKNGWVEHNAIEILNSQITTIRSVKLEAKIKSQSIVCIGIANQRETIVLWDKETGTPCYNAIAWQDKRTSDYCDSLINNGYNEMINQKTGLLINPYFSATKIKWVLDNVPRANELLKKGRLLCGTIDTWLLWNLTDGKSFYTDVTNASRTMLFNINTLMWDDDILELLNIPKSILPKVKPSCDFFGNITTTTFSASTKSIIPITAMIGDQQASLFGLYCFKKGDVKNTYGTGCFTLVNIGDKPVLSKNKLLTTIAWQLNNKKPVFALEGSVFVAGAAINWLKDGLQIISNFNDLDHYSKINKHANSIYVVPSFTGLGAPYWDSNSRGAIFGLTRDVNKEDIITATTYSIVYQCNDLLKTMEKDLNIDIKKVNVDGGASVFEYLMQFQSDISNIKVYSYFSLESSALGVAYLSGLQTGIWKNLKEISSLNKIKNEFSPSISVQMRKKLLKGWDESVKRTLNWTKDIS